MARTNKQYFIVESKEEFSSELIENFLNQYIQSMKIEKGDVKVTDITDIVFDENDKSN